MPASNLYDDDVHAWALVQAERLRAAAKAQDPDFNGIDLTHLSDEIESLAHSARRTVESSLEMALRLILMIGCLPEEASVKNRKVQMNSALDAAHDGYSPSMRDHIDLDRLWQSARKRALRDLRQDGFAVPVMPGRIPFRLDQLLDEDFNLDDLLETLNAVMPDDGSGMSVKD